MSSEIVVDVTENNKGESSGCFVGIALLKQIILVAASLYQAGFKSPIVKKTLIELY